MTGLGGSNTTAAVLTRTPSDVDEFGNRGTTVAASYVGEAIYAPGGSVEATASGDTVVTQPTVYLPTGTPVTATDQVIPQVALDDAGTPVLGDDGLPEGRRYDVDGEPTAWPANPFSGTVFDFSVDVKLKGQTG